MTSASGSSPRTLSVSDAAPDSVADQHHFRGLVVAAGLGQHLLSFGPLDVIEPVLCGDTHLDRRQLTPDDRMTAIGIDEEGVEGRQPGV